MCWKYTASGHGIHPNEAKTPGGVAHIASDVWRIRYIAVRYIEAYLYQHWRGTRKQTLCLETLQSKAHLDTKSSLLKHSWLTTFQWLKLQWPTNCPADADSNSPNLSQSRSIRTICLWHQWFCQNEIKCSLGYFDTINIMFYHRHKYFLGWLHRLISWTKNQYDTQCYGWTGMDADNLECFKTCNPCQRKKARHRNTNNLMAPLVVSRNGFDDMVFECVTLSRYRCSKFPNWVCWRQKNLSGRPISEFGEILQSFLTSPASCLRCIQFE